MKNLQKAQQEIEAIKKRLQAALQAKRAAIASLPKNTLALEHGQQLEASADALDTAIINLDDAITMISEACQ
ncbi:hypothetical protein [Chromobacterium vaccinii]|uniref:hypothetical protein n=1 Tax=Chromobacterium vaccinii TaxID=1108595 RepID=UPI0006180FC3|nr:hypothetical protein [Chromobacterium vaccinii]